MATAVRSLTPISAQPVSSLVVSWVLILPLLVFASQWGFSFEHGSINSAAGAHSSGADGGIAIKVQSALVYLTCAVVVMRAYRRVISDLLTDWLVLGLGVLTFLSVGWSQFPMVSLIHAGMIATNIAFAFYLLQRFSTNDLLKILVMVGWFAAIGSVLLVIFLPQYGIQDRSSVTSGAWEGIFAQKNICGFVMTNLLLPAFFVKYETVFWDHCRKWYILVLLIIIAMSRSAGSWFVCATCVLFVMAMRISLRMPRREVISIAISSLGIVILAGAAVYSNFNDIMYAIGKDPTLTGRTVIWSSLWASVMKRPLLGYGYIAFWGGLQGESANTALLMHWPGMGYAENGILELWLELGFVGVILYLLMFIRAVRDATFCFTRRPSPAVMWYVSSLFYLAVTNIEGGDLLATSDLGVILSFVVFVGLRRQARLLRAEIKLEGENGRFALVQAL